MTMTIYAAQKIETAANPNDGNYDVEGTRVGKAPQLVGILPPAAPVKQN